LMAFAATRPDTFRITRSITIDAKPEVVHALLNDFKGWKTWSPWEKKDPAMKGVFSGESAGVGAAYRWEGNKEVGTGEMSIIESLPGKLVKVKLDFLKPFEAHNTAEFTLTENANQTNVEWAMYGPQPFVAKLMSLVFNMEKMVGPDFEQGLASLKAQAEAPKK
jgi:Polyketide cyclase / dehydrase and lipid transport